MSMWWNKLAIVLLAVTGYLSACSTASAEIFDLGGMYTYHYRDGRYADWGDFALHGAHIAIAEANTSGILGSDQIRLQAENTIDYHCWPENAALMAETLGRAFFAESMFYREPNASKVALVRMVESLGSLGFSLIDCQQRTDNLKRFGARPVPRRRFLALLEKAVGQPTRLPQAGVLSFP